MKYVFAGAALMLAVGIGAQDTQALRVITYNIHHGEGTDGVLDLDRIAHILRELEGDVICLQEVDRNLSRSDRLDLAFELCRRLNMQAVFESNYDFDGGEFGNATLVRQGISFEGHENQALPGDEDTEPRGCLRTTLRVNGQRVHVLNTHFALTPQERKAQASAIIDKLPEGSVILAGDLNETPGAAGIEILTQRLRDAAGAEGAATAPSRAPRRRIDYILCSPDLTVRETRVIQSEATKVASDHLPVLAIVELPDTPSASEQTGIYGEDDPRIDDALAPERRP